MLRSAGWEKLGDAMSEAEAGQSVLLASAFIILASNITIGIPLPRIESGYFGSTSPTKAHDRLRAGQAWHKRHSPVINHRHNGTIADNNDGDEACLNQ